MTPETSTENQDRQAALIAAGLLADGWRECTNHLKKHARCFYKRFNTPTRCHCNDDKPGVQIQLSVSEHEGRASMELELRACLSDATWMTIHNYALPQTVVEVTSLIPRMLATWESANASAQR